jgi:ribonuclease E
MTTRMLIDARHQEETRVAVLKGNRIEEFDFESADHKQIKGNIYLAKVTRVEPSLQAALSISVAIAMASWPSAKSTPTTTRSPRKTARRCWPKTPPTPRKKPPCAPPKTDDDEDDEGGADDEGGYDDAEGVTESTRRKRIRSPRSRAVSSKTVSTMTPEAGEEARAEGGRRRRRPRRQGRGQSKEAEELRAKRMALRRRYKIQDVIQRRQVLLVQVVKEERGNKGAALTTYLSLAGRYCVLMPNSSHGGGISRKISSASDRKRLKQIIAELELPRSMSCIVRTAGLQRTKPEIKRDFDYLARLWDEIRESTMRSSAPALIHSDSDLIKRAIRDIYNRDIEEVVVEGEAATARPRIS